MFRTLTAATIALGVAAVPAAMADGHLEKAVKSRKALMVMYSWNLGQVGAMAKGAVEYNAEAAQMAADRLVQLAAMSDGALWPQGTDSTAMPGKTRAKAEAWTTWPKIAENQKAFATAAADLAAAAGQGLDALRPAVGAVGKTCGGCHKPYREEQ